MLKDSWSSRSSCKKLELRLGHYFQKLARFLRKLKKGLADLVLKVSFSHCKLSSSEVSLKIAGLVTGKSLKTSLMTSSSFSLASSLWSEDASAAASRQLSSLIQGIEISPSVKKPSISGL